MKAYPNTGVYSTPPSTTASELFVSLFCSCILTGYGPVSRLCVTTAIMYSNQNLRSPLKRPRFGSSGGIPPFSPDMRDPAVDNASQVPPPHSPDVTFSQPRPANSTSHHSMHSQDRGPRSRPFASPAFDASFHQHNNNAFESQHFACHPPPDVSLVYDLKLNSHRIPVLDLDNVHVWKRKMTDALGMKGVDRFLYAAPRPHELGFERQVYHFMRLCI